LSWAAKHHPTKHRGSVYDLKDDFDGALADYVTATRLDPNVASAYYHRSLVYFELGDSVRALADCAIAKLPRILTKSVGSTQIRVLGILAISPFRSPAERREFVEDLCSNEGMPSLIKEIERVIFRLTPPLSVMEPPILTSFLTCALATIVIRATLKPLR
jgi:TPR repeat